MGGMGPDFFMFLRYFDMILLDLIHFYVGMVQCNQGSFLLATNHMVKYHPTS